MSRSRSSTDCLANLRKALLVLHSPTDDLVGIENASAIFTAAKHPKSFVSLAGADHLLEQAADAVYVAEVIAAWSERYLDMVPEPDEMPIEGVLVAETRQRQVRAVDRRRPAPLSRRRAGLGRAATAADRARTSICSRRSAPARR